MVGGKKKAPKGQIKLCKRNEKAKRKGTNPSKKANKTVGHDEFRSY